MAILETGEATLVSGKKTYRLVLKTAGLMLFQKHFSTHEKVADLDTLLAKVNDGSIEHIAAFIWAALRKHHPDVTFNQTLDLIDGAGGVAGLAGQLSAVGASTVADAEDVKELTLGRNPRKARTRHRGTGANSTSAPAASV